MDSNRNTILWILGVVVVIAIAFMAFGSTRDGLSMNATSTPATTTTTTTGGTGNAGNAPSGNGSGVTESATMTIALGEERSVGGVTVKPTTVVEDSRCPANVQCVQAGTLKVNAVITSANTGGTFTRTLELGVPYDLGGGQTLTLTSVTPAAIAGGTPKTEDYRFTFTIRS
jgi:hypothetical protein